MTRGKQVFRADSLAHHYTTGWPRTNAEKFNSKNFKILFCFSLFVVSDSVPRGHFASFEHFWSTACNFPETLERNSELKRSSLNERRFFTFTELTTLLALHGCLIIICFVSWVWFCFEKLIFAISYPVSFSRGNKALSVESHFRLHKSMLSRSLVIKTKHSSLDTIFCRCLSTSPQSKNKTLARDPIQKVCSLHSAFIFLMALGKPANDKIQSRARVSIKKTKLNDVSLRLCRPRCEEEISFVRDEIC